MINGINRLVGFKAGWIALFILLFAHPDLTLAHPSSNFSENYVTSSGSFENKEGKLFSQSMQGQEPDPDSCQRWHGWVGINPQTQDTYKMQYDTLRHYIESCAQNEDSYEAFRALDGAVYMYHQNDTTRFIPYHDWLISVLYLNKTSDFYFCSCLHSIATSFAYGPYAKVHNAPFAVLKFLLDTPSCYSPGLEEFYNNSIKARHENWLQGDTTIPEDTVLPPLDSIGLGFLIHHNAAPPSKPLSQIYLASFTSSPNPFKNETHLRFHLNRMTYATIGIYDVLGHQVWGDGKGKSLDAGDHEVVVDGSLLGDGALYARIETGFGEVKTLKLVKE